MDLDLDFDGDGCGLGWFLPALIVGRVLADAFDRRGPRSWQPPPAPQAPPAPVPAEPQALQVCSSCRRSVLAAFLYCPHCGGRLGERVCRYCGQSVKKDLAHCPHCGGPAR